jgi:hypothetical protein
MPRKTLFKRGKSVEAPVRKTINGRSVKRFEPGFYSDGEAVYVDMDEFLETYGVCDVPEVRAILWMDIVEAFGDVPVYELGANTPTVPPGRRSALN